MRGDFYFPFSPKKMLRIESRSDRKGVSYLLRACLPLLFLMASTAIPPARSTAEAISISSALEPVEASLLEEAEEGSDGED